VQDSETEGRGRSEKEEAGEYNAFVRDTETCRVGRYVVWAVYGGDKNAKNEGRDMSSAFARQKKRLMRKRAMTDAQAAGIVQAINENAAAKRQEMQSMKPQLARETLEKLKKKWIPEVQGEILLYVLAFLRCERGYGKDRIKSFIHDFNAFADAMRRDNVHSPQVVELLRDECGIDIVHEFTLCDIETMREKRQLMAGVV
jgi:hypothetical protein